MEKEKKEEFLKIEKHLKILLKALKPFRKIPIINTAWVVLRKAEIRMQLNKI